MKLSPPFPTRRETRHSHSTRHNNRRFHEIIFKLFQNKLGRCTCSTKKTGGFIDGIISLRRNVRRRKNAVTTVMMVLVCTSTKLYGWHWRFVLSVRLVPRRMRIFYRWSFGSCRTMYWGRLLWQPSGFPCAVAW